MPWASHYTVAAQISRSSAIMPAPRGAAAIVYQLVPPDALVPLLARQARMRTRLYAQITVATFALDVPAIRRNIRAQQQTGYSDSLPVPVMYKHVVSANEAQSGMYSGPFVRELRPVTAIVGGRSRRRGIPYATLIQPPPELGHFT